MSEGKGIAVHFGGGNIGRGFVAEFHHETGYEVVFIDVVDELINKLNTVKSYNVTEISDEGESVKEIHNYRAINSKTNEDDAVDVISKAVVVTCAVGPNILKFIAPVIAKGIQKRTIEKPLAVIACENAIGATDTLAGFIKEKLSEEELKELPKKAEFGNSAIDRIVPTQKPDAGLNVQIERFYEWCVEKRGFKSGHPEIHGVHWVEDLEPYIERKLFTVNTSHATAAYFGHYKGLQTIHECLSDPEIKEAVREALSETSHLIVDKHEITDEDQEKYVESIIRRISNPYLEDVPDRVGRAPLRKLSRKERFIGPASQLAERGDKVDALLKGVEMALRFQKVEGDDESFKLAEILSSKSAEDATAELTGLETSHPLFDRVVAVVKQVQSETK
ncbi:putative mannitol-1-phosphate dehydrogenase [Phaeomoniella chlamydospora]|uniref:Mannitol-1-phosphate 5-dehydrogenase n=1 Tax=Phaeomoniella chlamydospora TaxID=158046 RepID=A0A0G2GBA1_PHACM|nr:putative mannitol-1-phosphate dehydrogenase [Phaeomoniella chlamydospora]